jgi:hypothetical protein
MALYIQPKLCLDVAVDHRIRLLFKPVCNDLQRLLITSPESKLEDGHWSNRIARFKLLHSWQAQRVREA